jgi:hypothetical protein
MKPELAQASALCEAGRLREANEAVEALLRRDSEDKEALALKRRIVVASLWEMVARGEAHWSGGKPKIPRKPLKLAPGPPVSDYIIEERDRLR